MRHVDELTLPRRSRVGGGQYITVASADLALDPYPIFERWKGGHHSLLENNRISTPPGRFYHPWRPHTGVALVAILSLLEAASSICAYNAEPEGVDAE